MIECERCGNPDCCERTDLRREPVLCDECYASEAATDQEIIDAFVCSYIMNGGDCENCKFTYWTIHGDVCDGDRILKGMLSIVERQQAEIEQLKEGKQ